MSHVTTARPRLQKPSRMLPSSTDAHALAAQRLPRLISDFIDGAAGEERVLQRNIDALAQVLLQPRTLADVRTVSLQTRLMGRTWGLPFGIAPMGMCDLAWPGTDHSFAALCRQHQMPLGVSTASSTPLEDLWQRSGANAWFQLYVTGSPGDALALADRAARVGYDTLMLTVDVPRIGKRPRDIRNGFSTPFRMTPRHFLDFATHPHWSIGTVIAGVPRMANFSGPNAAGYDRNAPRNGADWPFFQQLRDRWRGKLIVKGVLSAADAVQIQGLGADAIYVSNHGGRQLDSAPASLAALPAIRDAVGTGYPLIFDSGIRCGEDIVKARALGADFVMVGRPFLHAMAAVGTPGPQRLLQCLQGEIETTLAQLGLASIEAVGAHCLYQGTRGG